jgi:hypothetical protein
MVYVLVDASVIVFINQMESVIRVMQPVQHVAEKDQETV